jgi:hypothetical protein
MTLIHLRRIVQNKGIIEGIIKGINTAVKESLVEVVSLIGKQKSIRAQINLIKTNSQASMRYKYII